MTEDLSKKFEVVEKQKRVAYALEEAEKTLDINDFRKAVALLNELSEEEKEPLMESFQNVGNILRTYDRQRQSEIETLIGDAKEELDGNKLEEAEKLVNELLDEENKEIYRGMIKEYDEEFIQPKKLHDEIVGLIEEAKDTLDESLLDQARFLIEQVKSTEEQQLLKIEASKAQRFLNGIDEPEMIDEPKIKNTDNDKPEKKSPVNSDDLENKKYEEAKKLVDIALKTQKGDDINKAIKAIEELKDEKKKKELKDKLNSIKQIKDSNEDKKEPNTDKDGDSGNDNKDDKDKEEDLDKDEDKDLIVPEVEENKPAITWKKVISLAAGVGIGAGIALALGPSGVFGFAVAGVVANVIIAKKLKVPEEERLSKLHKVEMIEDPKNFKERFRNKINKARIYFNSDEGLKNLRCTINAAIVSGGIATVAINPYGPINWHGGIL